MYVKLQVGVWFPQKTYFCVVSTNFYVGSTSILICLFQSSPAISILQNVKLHLDTSKRKNSKWWREEEWNPKGAGSCPPFPPVLLHVKCADFLDPGHPRIPFLCGMAWGSRLQREASSPRARTWFGSFPANVTMLPPPSFPQTNSCRWTPAPRRKKVREMCVPTFP